MVRVSIEANENIGSANTCREANEERRTSDSRGFVHTDGWGRWWWQAMRDDDQGGAKQRQEE